MKAKATPEIIKLAFLGFTQESGSWKDAVTAKTNNVFSSRDTTSASAVLQKHFRRSPGPFDIRIAGYSWGGWTALEFASDLIIGSKVLRFFGQSVPEFTISISVLDPVNTLRSPVPANFAGHVTKVFNIFQRNGCYGSRCGVGTLGGDLFFCGEAIAGASNHNVTNEGRSGPKLVDGVPSSKTPDHVHLGYGGYGGHDKTVAAQLDA
jgi:hypothetical protein